MYSLAKGDPLKFEAVGKLNLIFALNVKLFEHGHINLRDYYNGKN